MSKTFRNNYLPDYMVEQRSRKIYKGHGVQSVFVLGGGHYGAGYDGHSNNRYLKSKSSRMLRCRLKEEARIESMNEGDEIIYNGQKYIVK